MWCIDVVCVAMHCICYYKKYWYCSRRLIEKHNFDFIIWKSGFCPKILVKIILFLLEKGAQTIQFGLFESYFPCSFISENGPLCIAASQRWLIELREAGGHQPGTYEPLLIFAADLLPSWLWKWVKWVSEWSEWSEVSDHFLGLVFLWNFYML